MNDHDHPCFSESGRHTAARIHLPVAPRCNMQCNYCNRDFACTNESRPGVTTRVLKPLQAADYLDQVMQKIPNIKVVGIAGPGDPCANGEETMETLRLVRARHPDTMLCLATNGLAISGYIDELSALGISHLTITVNAVDPEIASLIYAWVRPHKKAYRGLDAGRVVVDAQLAAIAAVKEKGIKLKINTVIIPGINEAHAVEVARRVAGLGADIQNCIAMYHVAATPFAGITPPSGKVMEDIRGKAGVYLPQMSHCSRCRADAAGMIGQPDDPEIRELLKNAALTRFSKEKPFIAVASMEGLFVNQHLGEAKALWLYEIREGTIDLIERRPTPPPGGGNKRWEDLAASLHDCGTVLVSGIGPYPHYALEKAGIGVVVMEGLAQEALEAIFAGKEIPKILLRQAGRCGMGAQCTGQGTGCG